MAKKQRSGKQASAKEKRVIQKTVGVTQEEAEKNLLYRYESASDIPEAFRFRSLAYESVATGMARSTTRALMFLLAKRVPLEDLLLSMPYECQMPTLLYVANMIEIDDQSSYWIGVPDNGPAMIERRYADCRIPKTSQWNRHGCRGDRLLVSLSRWVSRFADLLSFIHWIEGGCKTTFCTVGQERNLKEYGFLAGLLPVYLKLNIRNILLDTDV